LWRLLLADLAGNVRAAYTDFVDFEYKRRRNYPSQLSWKITSPLTAADLYVTDPANSEQVIAKLYNDTDDLVFCGVLQPFSDYKVYSDGQISSTAEAFDPLERLAKRVVGDSADGIVYSTATERREIVGDVIDTLNTNESCLLTPPPTSVSVGSCTTEIYRYKPAGELVTELSATLDGFDFWVQPTEPVIDADGLKLGQLMMATAAGANQRDVFFDHLTGKHNVKEWSRRILPVSNNHFALPSGFPSSIEDVVSSINTASVAQYGLRQQVIPADIVGEQLRGYLTYLHTAIRSTPVPQYSIELSEGQTSETYLTDYEVGDVVNVRLSDLNGISVDGQVRIYGYDIKVDEKAIATESITVTSGDIS